ncbi:MAG: SigE family RNA polymerase sigma factor [Nitriliruptoraceae bacterium]
MVRTVVVERSFAAVFNAHHREAVRLAYLLVSDADLAEDVVAEAFTKVYRRWVRGEVRDVGAYLRRAVANEANSRLRRRYRERAEASRRSGDDRGVQAVDDGAADRDEVWRALARLPDRQRHAIVLRYYEDLPEAEVADILGVSVGTVKSQVSRGLDRLTGIIEAPASRPDDGHAARRYPPSSTSRPATVQEPKRGDQR